MSPATAIIGGVRFLLASSQPLHARAIERCEERDAGIVFDATKLQFASPLDLVALASWTASIRTQHDGVAFVLPALSDVRRYLTRMDLVAHLEASGVSVIGPRSPMRRVDRADVLLEVRKICDSAEAEVFFRDVYALLSRHTTNRAAVAGAKILGELLDNAISHGESPVGAYAAAQVHRRGGDVELAVSDAGIGIRSHLARNPRFRELTTNQAITAALRPGVSGTPTSRGNGLPDLLEMASGYGGQLLLRSDDGYGHITPGPRRRFTTAERIPGTWAWVQVRLPRHRSTT